METKKMKLQELEIESFVTQLSIQDEATLQGGALIFTTLFSIAPHISATLLSATSTFVSVKQEQANNQEA